MNPSIVQDRQGGVVLAVYVQPKASRTEWVGLHGCALKIRVAAPPVDGAANEALTRFLADELSIPVSAVRIEKGAGGRQKRVALMGLRASEVEAYLVRKGLATA